MLSLLAYLPRSLESTFIFFCPSADPDSRRDARLGVFRYAPSELVGPPVQNRFIFNDAHLLVRTPKQLKITNEQSGFD